MTKIKTLIAIMAIVAIGCKKEDKPVANDPVNGTPSHSVIEGAYRFDKERYLDSTGFPADPDVDYFLFVEKDSVIWVTIDTIGFRSVQKFKRDSNVFYIREFEFRMEQHDSILILNDILGDQRTFYRKDNLLNRNMVFTFYNENSQFTVPRGLVSGPSSGMVSISNSLYVLNYQDAGPKPVIYVFNKNSGNLTDSISINFIDSTNFCSGAMCIADGYFWIVNNGALEKVDPQTGNSVFRSAEIGSTLFLNALTFDGSNLLLGSSDQNSAIGSGILEYNLSTQTLTKRLDCFEFVTGLAFKDGKLFVTKTNSISVCSANPFKIEKVYCPQDERDFAIIGFQVIEDEFWMLLDPRDARTLSTFAKVHLN